MITQSSLDTHKKDLIAMKKAKLAIGDIVEKARDSNTYKEITGIRSFFGDPKRVSYRYRDNFGFIGECSEQHILRWQTT